MGFLVVPLQCERDIGANGLTLARLKCLAEDVAVPSDRLALSVHLAAAAAAIHAGADGFSAVRSCSGS
jgi:hypothetical protein